MFVVGRDPTHTGTREKERAKQLSGYTGMATTKRIMQGTLYNVGHRAIVDEQENGFLRRMGGTRGVQGSVELTCIRSHVGGGKGGKRTSSWRWRPPKKLPGKKIGANAGAVRGNDDEAVRGMADGVHKVLDGLHLPGIERLPGLEHVT